MQAQWGPELSTAGLSIDLKEVGRTKEPDGSTQIAWQITGKGFPADQKLVLTQWPLDAKPQNVMSGIQLDSQGVAVCIAPPLPATGPAQGPAIAASPGQAAAATPSPNTPSQVPDCGTKMKPGQPVEIRAAVAPGEAIRVALVGQSEKNGGPIRIGAATSVVPFPMANTDKGCRLQVIRGMKNAGMVLVEGTGFPANTPMKVDTVTSGQTRTVSTRTNSNGRFILATLPALAGEDAGDTTVHMSSARPAPSLEAPKTPAAAEPACDPTVSFHWGKDSYKPQ